ncbi:MAG: hypothetical protein M3M99_03105 [Actinomycetota bacterium]|nr:hypothetical protein [Actinomycetota bacterium]
MALTSLILAHVGGIPVEETLAGVMVGGVAGLRAATLYLRRRVTGPRFRRAQPERPAGPGSRRPAA